MDFSSHLQALSAEYERLRLENAQLKERLKAYEELKTESVTVEVAAKSGKELDLIQVELRAPPKEVDKKQSRAFHILDWSAMLLTAVAIGAGIWSLDVITTGHKTLATILNIVFSALFICELFGRMKIFGVKGYLWGQKIGSWIDLFCALLGPVILVLELLKFVGVAGVLNLPLILGRVIRLKSFQAWSELKAKTGGPLFGVVWFMFDTWFFFLIFAVVTRVLFVQTVEFATVNSGMKTLFGCSTGLCVAHNGQPLTSVMATQYGLGLVNLHIVVHWGLVLGILRMIMMVMMNVHGPDPTIVKITTMLEDICNKLGVQVPRSYALTDVDI